MWKQAGSICEYLHRIENIHPRINIPRRDWVFKLDPWLNHNAIGKSKYDQRNIQK